MSQTDTEISKQEIWNSLCLYTWIYFEKSLKPILRIPAMKKSFPWAKVSLHKDAIREGQKTKGAMDWLKGKQTTEGCVNKTVCSRLQFTFIHVEMEHASFDVYTLATN